MTATENAAKETTVTDTNRETWLIKAVDALRPLFAEVGEEIPTVRISVGFPGGGSAKKRIGECWAPAAASDEVSQLFVSPILDDAARVLDVLSHELIHAIDRCESGHKGRFTKIAKGIGLTGKMTATVASPELKEKLDAIVEELGEYPHAAISLGGATSGPKKQTTRMVKIEADCCGYTVRTTQKWIDQGMPSCPCGNEMRVA